MHHNGYYYNWECAKKQENLLFKNKLFLCEKIIAKFRKSVYDIFIDGKKMSFALFHILSQASLLWIYDLGIRNIWKERILT